MSAQRCDQREYRSIGGDLAEVTLSFEHPGRAVQRRIIIPLCQRVIRGRRVTGFARIVADVAGRWPELVLQCGRKSGLAGGAPFIPLPCIE